MSLLVFFYCICDFLCCCRSFNPSFCHLLPFHLDLCCYFKAMLAYQNFTLTGPHLPNLLIKSHNITCAHPKHAQYAVSN